MSEIIDLNQDELNRIMDSTDFLFEPHVSVVEFKVANKVEHIYSMRIIVPKGKQIICHRHHNANPVNRTTELHLHYYDTSAKPPVIKNLDQLVFPSPIPITINNQPFDLYLAFFSIQDFGVRGDERLWPKVRTINGRQPMGHDGTVHLPGGGS